MTETLKALPQPDLSSLLAQKKPSLLALPAEMLLRPRVRRTRAQELSEIFYTRFEPFLPRLENDLSPSRSAEIRATYHAFPELFWLFHQADLLFEISGDTEVSNELRSLSQDARRFDDELEQACLLLFRSVPQEQERIAKIRLGRGRRDDAEDILAWLELLGRYPSLRSNLATLTDPYLQSARTTASRLLQILQIPSVAEAADLWRRAYTLWADAYRALRKAALFLSPDDRASDFPGIAPEVSPQTKPSVPETPSTPPNPSTPASPPTPPTPPS